MKIEYKCPTCRANNILTEKNTICRRCESDLSSIYKLKKNSIHAVLNDILKKGSR